MPQPALICHLSFNHSPFDDRIYWKELISLKEQGYQVVHIAVGEIDDDLTTKEGIRIITVQRRKFFKNPWLNRLAQLLFPGKSTVNAILRQAKALKADLYHYHDLQLNALVKPLKRLPQKPKVIYDAHEAYHLLFQEQRPRNIISAALYTLYTGAVSKWELRKASDCDYIITTDDYTLDYFNAHLPNIPKENVFNYSYFLNSKSQNKSLKYHFIYTGLLSEGRGITESIKAFKLVTQQHEQIRMLLIGDFESPEFQIKIETLIDRLGLKDNIELKKSVPFSRISSFYEASYIGLGLFQKTPKYSTFIPIKLFEYMAFGLPVIFSNHGPSASIIKKAECGILVEGQHITDIAKAMNELLENKDLYDKLSLQARNAVAKEYNWEKEKEKLYRIYDRLLHTTNSERL